MNDKCCPRVKFIMGSRGGYDTILSDAPGAWDTTFIAGCADRPAGYMARQNGMMHAVYGRWCRKG